MVRRSCEEWWGLFDEQARSGMSERVFCEARGLSAAYFSLRRKQLGWARREPAGPVFLRMERAPVTARSQEHPPAPCAVLRLGRCEWELRGLSEDGLLRMMAALA